MSKKIFSILFLCFVICDVTYAQTTIALKNSGITSAALPAKAEKILPENISKDFNQIFSMMLAEGKGKIVGGESEVVVWKGNYQLYSNVTKLTNQLKTCFRNAGWQFESMETKDGYEFFNLYKSAKPKRVAVGFFHIKTDAVSCGLMEIFLADTPKPVPGNSNNNQQGAPQINSSPKVITVDKDTKSVNVMGSEMPHMPQFPSLQPKPGTIRGYVKDWQGKPLAGAELGVRTSYIAGFYSGGQGKTDANGYYELTPPKGMAHFYCAGYQVKWGNGVAALSLHPADGKLEQFITMDGAVENFVVLPYGVTSSESLQQNPHLPSTYYGGAINLSWYAVEGDDNNAPSFAIKEKAELEITLTPDGNLLDGSAGRKFIIRKTAGLSGTFKIHNIPLGSYRISISANGKVVKIKDNNGSAQLFGMKPIETTGSGSILFVPDQAKASMVMPQYGAWKWMDLTIETE